MLKREMGVPGMIKKFNLINILILLIALKYSESSLLFGFFAIVQH